MRSNRLLYLPIHFGFAAAGWKKQQVDNFAIVVSLIGEAR
jgi:hypothetical protein